MIHFSDDVLLSCKPERVQEVEEMVRKQFQISFEPVGRWVSMEFGMHDGGIDITTQEAAKGMSEATGRFTLNLLDKLRLTGPKIEVPTEFRSAMGR